MKIIAVSNIKGGTGKSTVCANLVCALAQDKKVLAIDIDKPQYTLSNYFKYRNKEFDLLSIKNNEELEKNINDNQNYDYIIIDTPGGITELTEKVSKLADVFITPVSDSRLDLDVIGQCTQNDEKFTPGCYSNLIWEARKFKLMHKKPQLEWIIIPNKLNTRVTNNQKQIIMLLKKMQKTFMFSLCSGIKDRTVFKELFNEGKTVFDLPQSKLNISNIAARNEIRSIVMQLNKILQEKFD